MGVFIMMLTISWQMTIIAVFVLPVSFGLISLVMKKSQKYFTQQQNSLGAVDGHIEEMYGGHMVVKAFNGEEDSIRSSMSTMMIFIILLGNLSSLVH